MASKKLAATLGTGTLGAGGAAGAAALNMGLFNRTQNEAIDEAAKVPSLNAESKEITGPSNPNASQASGSGAAGGQGGISNTYFAGESVFDIKAVKSNNWKTEESIGGGVTIKVEDGSDAWQCTIKGIVFDDDKKQSINDRVKEFVNGIKDDENKRKKLVENCAKARLDKEKNGGKDSTIELEVEKNGKDLKIKGLENLLNEDFAALERLGEEYQSILKRGSLWSVKQNIVNGKVEVNLTGDKFGCTIYGEIVGGVFEDPYDLVDEDINGILDSGYEDETYNTDLEKKKFLIRNCLRNNNRIEGLRVVSYNNEQYSAQKWKFENLDEILTKLHDNPGK